ncbi:PAS domain-containing sensor histidine kinase [Phyllobacterium lublinensis]|uniref:PAS domain-containing sensor histidine kinase n=1 Tax=Phyllobacterium lublinensis TaxID=2875708 RepID=UPI001CCADB31|nr:PAS domain-containing sensor histidine kinase [Phyllobacterium sp. 2063]MBZ9657298.1 PAS domain-containing sensor histidine kinase [Phyllobacterium sp. 2063]
MRGNDPNDLVPPNEDFEDLYENAPCGYLSMLPNGRIFKVNRTYLAWTGYSHDEIIGRPLRDFLPVAGKMFYETHFAPLLRIQGFYNEVALDIVTARGSRIPMLANALQRMDGSGQLLFTRLTLFPAADRRRFERGLVDAQAASNDKIKTLEADSELREQFVAVLGHDLRNPLASISGGIRMLERDAAGKDEQVLKLMQGSVTRMSALIDDVMDFARSRLGGGIGVELKPTDVLEAVLEQVVAELRTAEPDWVLTVSVGRLGTVICDAARIGQMVSNLLGNALVHGSKTQPVRLLASTKGGALEIEVVNAGEAIPSDQLERLFKPFIRGESSGAREGLGLGLFIASEIAKAHGATLVATSTPEETRFKFSMRVDPVGG